MSDQNTITIGDRVRVRYGNHVGEIATVSDITLHSNQFGAYAASPHQLRGGRSRGPGHGQPGEGSGLDADRGRRPLSRKAIRDEQRAR